MYIYNRQSLYLYWVLLRGEVDVPAGDVAGVVVRAGSRCATGAALLLLTLRRRPVRVPAQVDPILQAEVEPHLGGGGGSLEARGQVETLLLLLKDK